MKNESLSSRKWLFLVEVIIGAGIGLLSSIIMIWQSALNRIDMRAPLDYFADTLQYANWVSNAQSGDVLFNFRLGAPLGQQYGLSAYGYEWIQAEIIGSFASANAGPWLAINRYILFCTFMAAFTAYISFRWLGSNKTLSLLGAVIFSAVPYFTGSSGQALNLGMVATIPLVITACIKLLEGKNLQDLVFNYRSSKRNYILNASCLFVIAFFGFLGAFYYQMLLILIIFSTTLILLIRKQFESAKAGTYFIGFMMIPLLISYAPIIFSRLYNQLGISEVSTGDRRPFAVYANSGDLFSLFSPLSPDSFIYGQLSKIGPIMNFFNEYWSSSINNNAEYSGHPIGTTLIVTLILFSIFYIRNRWKQVIYDSKKFFSSDLNAILTLLLVSILWYVRGGFGTFAGFVFPYMRVYSRVSVIILFISIAFLFAIIRNHSSYSKKSYILSVALATILAVDSSSSMYPIRQTDTDVIIKAVGTDELPGASKFKDGLEVRTLGIKSTRNLIAKAEEKLSKECSILVLPLVNFPVDFQIGVASYYGYETIKPGLEPSSLNWSSGGIAGTPNNLFVEKWLPNYREARYQEFLSAVQSSGYCGILNLRSLQQLFHDYNLTGNMNYGPSEGLTTELVARFGAPCYSDIDAALDLYCLPK